LGFCFCFEAGCFFFGAIWPRAPGVLALPSDRHRQRRAFGTPESRGTAACWVLQQLDFCYFDHESNGLL
jgi:hypothetical protein